MIQTVTRMIWRILMDLSEHKFDDDEIVKLHANRDNQPDARLKVRFIALLINAG